MYFTLFKSSAFFAICLCMLVGNVAAQIGDPLCEPNTQISNNAEIEIIGEVELTVEDVEGFDGATKKVTTSAVKPGICVPFSQSVSLVGVLEWNTEKSEGAASNAIIVDELVLDYRPTDLPVRLAIGHNTIPFGVYESDTITSPLTADVFEMKGKLVSLTYATDTFSVETYAFQAERDWEITRRSGEQDAELNQETRYGVNLMLEHEWDGIKLATQAGLTNNGFGAGDMFESFDGHPNSLVGQLSIIAESDNWFVLPELIKVFESATYESAQRKPTASSITLGYAYEGKNVEVTPMLAYSQTSGLSGVMPQQRITAAMLAKLTEHVEVIAEFGLDWDYNGQNSSRDPAHYAGTRLILKW